MSPSDFREAVPEGDGLVIDTSAVIAFLTGNEAASFAASRMFDELVASERNPAVLSAISAAELLVRPILGGARQSGAMRSFLLGFPGLSIRSADFLVAAEAARIRGAVRATLSDALIAATATLTSSPWLITNDRALRDRLAGFDWSTSVLLLADFAA